MKKKNEKFYFTKETEDYINMYNASSDPELRASIFTKHIYLPFYKLAENIIHTFKFHYMDVNDVEDLKHEIVTMLLEEKIHKFKPELGTKAYSYFGTIVKRWLISYNNKNYRKKKQIRTLDDVDDYVEEHVETYDKTKTLSEFVDSWVECISKELPTMFSGIELEVAEAILTLFRTRKDLDVFRKKALYIYVREITNCETPYLTKVVSVLKAHFYKKYEAQLEEGVLDLKPL